MTSTLTAQFSGTQLGDAVLGAYTLSAEFPSALFSVALNAVQFPLWERDGRIAGHLAIETTGDVVTATWTPDPDSIQLP